MTLSTNRHRMHGKLITVTHSKFEDKIPLNLNCKFVLIMEGYNVGVVNVTVLQILNVSGVKEVRTLPSLAGRVMRISTMLIYAVVYRCHVHNVLAIITNCMGQYSMGSNSFLSCSKIPKL
jgi:hypothetical protein